MSAVAAPANRETSAPASRLERYCAHGAVNGPYLAWQLEQFAPYLGQRILEVGCGIGGIIALLGARELIYGLDVEPDVLEHAARRFAGRDDVRFERLDLTDCSPARREALRALRFDTVVCINALEHIADDGAALARMGDVLVPGGHVALLVPAHAALYGEHDRLDGHFRRYDARRLRRLAEGAALDVQRLSHFNALGAVGWWVRYRLWRRRHGPAQFRAMNRWLPVCRRVERLIRPPFGLSLVAVLKKSEAAP